MASALKWVGLAPWLWCVAAQAAVIDYVFVDGFEAQVDCVSADLACPPPASGQACLAGRIAEAGAGTPMRAFFDADLTCADGARGGACNLQLTVYDALSLAGNPSNAQPLPATVVIDGCARFRITGLTPPALGFAAIVAEDIDPAAESDLHAPSALMLPVGANQEIEDLDVVVSRRDTVARWTVSAGSPFGASTFADVGAILMTFTAAGVPVAGVAVTRNGSAASADDYYFSDANPSQRYVVASLATTTGANGSALVVNSPFVDHSGLGSEPPGCTWPTVLSTSIAGYVVFVAIEC